MRNGGLLGRKRGHGFYRYDELRRTPRVRRETDHDVAERSRGAPRSEGVVPDASTIESASTLRMAPQPIRDEQPCPSEPSTRSGHRDRRDGQADAGHRPSRSARLRLTDAVRARRCHRGERSGRSTSRAIDDADEGRRQRRAARRRTRSRATRPSPARPRRPARSSEQDELISCRAVRAARAACTSPVDAALEVDRQEESRWRTVCTNTNIA